MLTKNEMLRAHHSSFSDITHQHDENSSLIASLCVEFGKFRDPGWGVISLGTQGRWRVFQGLGTLCFVVGTEGRLRAPTDGVLIVWQRFLHIKLPPLIVCGP
jgi:hypothetical protein